ncbi:MAG: hypothetical protein J0H68_09605 [Sphingobacteriia bacterium]|nr:hypothetical protein [Sphingobacteriia bacterium]
MKLMHFQMIQFNKKVFSDYSHSELNNKINLLYTENLTPQLIQTIVFPLINDFYNKYPGLDCKTNLIINCENIISAYLENFTTQVNNNERIRPSSSLNIEVSALANTVATFLNINGQIETILLDYNSIIPLIRTLTPLEGEIHTFNILVNIKLDPDSFKIEKISLFTVLLSHENYNTELNFELVNSLNKNSELIESFDKLVINLFNSKDNNTFYYGFNNNYIKFTKLT